MRKKLWYMFCYLIRFYSFNNTCIFPSQKLSNNLLPLPSRSKNQIFLGFSDFILLVTRSLKDNHFRTILLFQKAVHEIHMLTFFLFRSYIQIWFVSWFLYLSKCVHASTCFLKIPIKVKIFLSIFSLQRIAHNCCLFCSVKNEFSDTYWNWRSRQWSHCYAWSLRSAYFFKVAQRMFFLRGGSEIDERALVTIANQNFCCLSNWKIHRLIC